MQLTVNGVLTDYKGRILLKQQAARALSLIGHSLEPGVLPTETLLRAFRDATGLVVMPVRVTGLYYDGHAPGGEMSFCFRCTLRGGELQVPIGSPPAGFFDCPPLPAALKGRHRRQAEQALHHTGGLPVMEREGESLGKRLSRLFGDRVAVAARQDWDVMVLLVVDAGHGQIVWSRSGSREMWRLPTTEPGAGETPWEAAAGLLASTWPAWGKRLDSLSLVEIAADHPKITFVFAASIYEPPFPRSTSETLAFAQLELVTDQYASADVEIVELVGQAAVTPIFRLAKGSG